MDLERKPRSGMISVIAALLVVCAFWLLFVPRTEFYKNYKQKSDLERTLRAISPPAGATLTKTDTMPFSAPVRVVLMGYYQAPSAFDVVKSHYMQEFPRRGFVYQPRVVKGSSNHALEFCSPGYVAVLSNMVEDGRPLAYMILLRRRDGPC